jgi:hypothetical protein
MDPRWEALSLKICRNCIDGDGKGNCRLPIGDKCALKEFFPELVSTVLSVQSPSYDDYVTSLRATVCAKCDFHLPGDRCGKRDALECALDRYFPLVIEIIEDLSLHLRNNPTPQP